MEHQDPIAGNVGISKLLTDVLRAAQSVQAGLCLTES